eukprot:9491299-Pyramimonas_sp.AAC.1
MQGVVYVVVRKITPLKSGAQEADQQMEMTIKLAMQLKTQQVDQQMEIRTEPKHKKDMGYGRVQVRDVMMMSQTAYVRGFAPGPKRHNSVHNFEGDVCCGQPYDRVSTP